MGVLELIQGTILPRGGKRLGNCLENCRFSVAVAEICASAAQLCAGDAQLRATNDLRLSEEIL